MATIDVDTNRLIASSGEIAVLAAKMSSICATLECIELSNIMENRSTQQFYQHLKRATDETLEDAAKMRTLSGALHMIAHQYRRTEMELAGALTGSISTLINLAGRSVIITYLVQMVLTWLRQKHTEVYDVPTREQELAADEAMRGRLREVLQDEKYSQENWEKASVEERKQILQDYMNEVVDIYGLKNVKPEIIWESGPYDEETVLWGYYYDEDHTVTLNEQVLTDSVPTWDSYDMLGTVSHELRHAYQHEAIANPAEFVVSPDTLSTWSNNIDNYLDGVSSSFEEYYNQPIEVDARSFEI